MQLKPTSVYPRIIPCVVLVFEVEMHNMVPITTALPVCLQSIVYWCC